MGNWWRDLKFGLRMLSRNKGFTTVAVLALALGIGPNVAMFSVIWAMFLAPLPYPQPDQIVVVWTKIKGERAPTRADDFMQYQKQSTSFQNIYFYPWTEEPHLTNPDHTEDEISGSYAQPGSYSQELRLNMVLGRDFLPEEGIPGNDRVVLLKHRLWVERFHSDPNILGKQILINNDLYTVVGVEQTGPLDRQVSQFDIPFSIHPGHDPNWGGVSGRLKPGVSIAQAQAELSVIDQHLADTRRNSVTHQISDWAVSVEPLKNDWLDKRLERNLWLLLGAVGFVLLIACANVANLLLARGTSRQKEIAVRSSLGATRRQVFVQLLVENLTLSSLGGIIGVFLGWALIKVIISLIPDYTLYTENLIQLNIPVMLFAVGVVLLGGLLFGCFPAWRSAKLNLSETLKQGSQAVVGGKRMRTQATLVIVEFALAITLLAGAGMTLHSFWKMSQIDLGFRTDHIFMAHLQLANKELGNVDQIRTDTTQLLEKLKTLPGVKNAAVASNLPLEGFDSFRFGIAGQPVPQTDQSIADYQVITPGYFDTFGIHLIRGRILRESDNSNNPQVVMVSESFVQKYLQNLDPLGQSLLLPNILPGQTISTPTAWQIVGVFQDVNNGQQLTGKTAPEIFGSYWQNTASYPRLAVRTALDPALISNSIRHTVAIVEPSTAIRDVSTMQKVVDDNLRNDRFGMALFASFAALALLLAAVGIYGVMAFAVAQRKHEIGLRIALGAQKQDVVNLILGNGIKLALLGAGIGLIGVYIIGRLMRSILYGIDTVDFTSFAAVAFVLLLTAVIASYIPARRSAKVDPMVALRQE